MKEIKVFRKEKDIYCTIDGKEELFSLFTLFLATYFAAISLFISLLSFAYDNAKIGIEITIKAINDSLNLIFLFINITVDFIIFTIYFANLRKLKKQFTEHMLKSFAKLLL